MRLRVIHLRFYMDDSPEGIAAALGCSVGTVKSRLFTHYGSSEQLGHRLSLHQLPRLLEVVIHNRLRIDPERVVERG
jgi:hypothetical protein